MKTRYNPLYIHRIGGAILLSLTLPGLADTIAYWNFNGLSIAVASAPGSGGVPTTMTADVGAGTLSLTGFGGTVDDFSGSALNALGGVAAEESLSLVAGGTVDPFPGNNTSIDLQLNLTGFHDPIITFATRGTSSGFTTGTWSYSTGGAFTALPDNTATTSTSYSVKTLDLSSIDALDGAAAVTLRYTVSGATSSSGNNRIDNLLVSATPSGGDTTPPSVSTFSPPDDATDVTLDSLDELTITFSEDIATVTGNILVKKVSDNSIVNTVDVADFGQVTLNGSQLGLIMANPLAAATAYYVEVPSGAIVDLAPVPNAFPGFSGSTTWNFTTAPPPTPPSVVVNKYVNATPDRVELLVIGTGISGSTVDLRGMILKDYSSSVDGDNGGSYTFSTNAIWESVPAGTLIVLSETATSPDTDDSNFTLNVGLMDEAYFDVTDGNGFDIAGTEMVMIKAAGSVVDGNAGGIHALSGGILNPTSYFSTFTGAKLRTDGASGTNAGVRALNSTSTLDDYISGTDAEGGIALAAGDFGVPNSVGNATYISELRGLEPGDGDGLASVVNSTVGSPFLDSGIFDDGQTSQSAKVTLAAQTTGVTLSNITVAVPAALGTPGGATVGGTGAAGASVSVVGQNVTITNASVTTDNAIEITINGLTTPTPTLAGENGNYALTISTSATGGTLTPLASLPAVRVVIPVASLRDTDVNGVSLDAGSIVAVEGVITEEDFGSGSANFSAFLQDTGAGINIFSPTTDPGFIRGNRYAVVGTVTQFNGLTEIIPSSAAGIVSLGASTEPAAQVVSLATLLASPEALEGKLIQVQNLDYLSGTWAAAQTVVLTDGTTNIDIRIQSGSTATTEPSYPVNVTGILAQFDSSSPFTAGYQLMPRDAADLTPGIGGDDYASWATENGIPGEPVEGDFDSDGISNLLEYGLGLSPTAPSGSPGSFNGTSITFTKGADALANGDVDWAIETSPTLGADPSPWTAVTASEVGNTISYTLPTGQGKVFARLVVTQQP